MHITSLVLIYLIVGNVYFLCTSSNSPTPLCKTLINTNMVSQSLSLFLTCSQPTTQCQFLVYNIVIKHLCTLQNDHHNKSINIWHHTAIYIIIDCIPHTVPLIPLFVCSVSQLYLTLCDPMDCSMPGFPVLHHLLEFTQTHVY